MPSQQHDAIANLFRWEPSLTNPLLTSMGMTLPETKETRLVSESFNVLNTSEYTGDAAIMLISVEAEKQGVVIEVQRQKDNGKTWSWPVYVSVLRARHHCPTALLVLAVGPESLAEWCARPIDMGHPGHVLRPLVLRPDQVPVITDPEEVAAAPPIAILSALYHATPSPDDKILSAIAAAYDLLYENQSPSTASKYNDYVFRIVSDDVCNTLEDLMATKSHHRPHTTEDIRIETRVDSVLRVLEVRGIDVTDAARERITTCHDYDTLGTWHDRAVTATTVDELFQDS